MISIPFIVCIAGLSLWCVATASNTIPGKAVLTEVGRISFAVGLFWTLYAYVGKVAF